MNAQKYLFIDRDGTLIKEPADEQVDSIEKLEFLPGVFTALKTLRDAGFKLVMITNQDGLGTTSFPVEQFKAPHQLMLNILASQGITFEAVHVCPHFEHDQCECRKPKVTLLLDYFIEQKVDLENSYVIGDRDSDIALAQNLKLSGLKIGEKPNTDWATITKTILQKPRRAQIIRNTNETNITVDVDLDQSSRYTVNTGIGFFDHMLEQFIKHAGISASIEVKGDLQIDDHHTVEDTGLALGAALKKALADKQGIERYGFVLPMDEACATIALDLSGRACCRFNGEFSRERINDLSTEMIPHFFKSLSDGLQATLHINLTGENNHHLAEAAFKGFGRALGQAIVKNKLSIPSTKGVL